MIFLRVTSLAMGRSGIRMETVNALTRLGNSGFTPVVPCRGSLGASGDLAPLAHMCLPILGEGECFDPEGNIITGSEALELLGIQPVELMAKEGLALINGTQAMTAVISAALLIAENLMTAADAAAAITLEALLGTDAALDPELIGLRPHPGAGISAERIRTHLLGSEIVHSHPSCGKVQDAYSLPLHTPGSRCLQGCPCLHKGSCGKGTQGSNGQSTPHGGRQGGERRQFPRTAHCLVADH